jgi:hypothetical protein
VGLSLWVARKAEPVLPDCGVHRGFLQNKNLAVQNKSFKLRNLDVAIRYLLSSEVAEFCSQYKFEKVCVGM